MRVHAFLREQSSTAVCIQSGPLIDLGKYKIPTAVFTNYTLNLRLEVQIVSSYIVKNFGRTRGTARGKLREQPDFFQEGVQEGATWPSSRSGGLCTPPPLHRYAAFTDMLAMYQSTSGARLQASTGSHLLAVQLC